MAQRKHLLCALVVGALVAVAIGGGRHVTASTAQDIPVYTAQTPTVYTAETPTVVTAETIDPYQAAQVAFYQSTTIAKLPPAQSIKKLTGKGGSFSLPANCNALCSAWAWAITDNIAIGLWGAKAHREITLGRAKLANVNGRLTIRLPLSDKYRAKLRRVRHPVKITVRARIVDAQYGFKKEQEQRVTLRP